MLQPLLQSQARSGFSRIADCLAIICSGASSISLFWQSKSLVTKILSLNAALENYKVVMISMKGLKASEKLFAQNGFLARRTWSMRKDKFLSSTMKIKRNRIDESVDSKIEKWFATKGALVWQ